MGQEGGPARSGYGHGKIKFNVPEKIRIEH